MQVFFMGGEQAAWCRLLTDNGADGIGMSYFSLARRVKKIPTLAMKFPVGHDLLLESGGFQANAKPQERTREQWLDYAAEYTNYAVANQERATLITEFDCLALGIEWIHKQRATVWSDVDPAKFVPVWHPVHGIDELAYIVERWPQVAVVESVLTEPGQSLVPHLRAVQRLHGTLVHGISLTKPEIVEVMPFDSVSSSSWLSPTRYGDTVLYDGKRLHRYNARQKDVARTRHQTWLSENGFRTDLLAEGNKRELTELSIWSWLQWRDDVNARRSNREPVRSAPVDLSSAGAEVAAPAVEPVAEPVELIRRPTIPLPIFGVVERDVPNPDSPTTTLRELVLSISGGSERVCDSCFLATKGCPGYKPHNTCEFEIPLIVETKTQRKALYDGIVALQAKRVAFLQLSEDLSGGYPDPNLSAELKALTDMMVKQAEMERSGDYFKISIEGRSSTPQAGLLSQVFGNRIGAAASAVEAPLDRVRTDRVIEAEGITR